mmetsp:Transcript_33080/g.85240  ORF Transcript_33080/g.85240 Transcript_33080/m.85240 type:complete len:731 (+) Transcript_33080:37-2229(+)
MPTPCVPRPEHPNPIFQRDAWISLNGDRWDYALGPVGQQPTEWDGNITVPFCLQSELSGTGASLSRALLKKFRPPLASGISRKAALWYRLKLPKLPAAWSRDGVRILLHIGACDFSAKVTVNSSSFPEHHGASSPICHDITDALEGRHGNGHENVVLLRCTDHEGAAGELLPCGKQARRGFPGNGPHIATIYSNVTGIWQSVWLEAVGSSTHLTRVHAAPRAPEPSTRQAWRVALYPKLSAGYAALSSGSGSRVFTFEASLFSKLDCSGTAIATGRIRLSGHADDDDNGDEDCLEFAVPSAAERTWSPKDPHLYGLRYRLLAAKSQVIDTVWSYVGLREVCRRGDQLWLNGSPLYLRMVLDQGWYPDGLWTAPTKEALLKDIQSAQRLGFNGARLHQKVFEPWYFFYADQCGFLVMAEYPDWPGDKTRRFSLPLRYKQLVQREWRDIVDRFHNHPSIIAWTTLNECGPSKGWKARGGPGGGFQAYRTEEERQQIVRGYKSFVKSLVAVVRASDRQHRPVHDVSGYNHVPAAEPDLWSFHNYEQKPDRFKLQLQDPPKHHIDGRQGQPLFVAEYGGVGMEAGGPIGCNPPKFHAGYRGGFSSTQGCLALARIRDLTTAIYSTQTLSGFCYTQLYDIEYEKNGLLRYDRTAKPGLSASALRRIFDGNHQQGRWSGVGITKVASRQKRKGLAAQLRRVARRNLRGAQILPSSGHLVAGSLLGPPPPAKRRRRT